MLDIKRRDLWESLNKINQKDWIYAVDRLGLMADVSGGKGSHMVIRNSKYPVSDQRGRIATIQRDLGKQHNQTIFKHVMKYGIAEDDIWRALKMLK